MYTLDVIIQRKDKVRGYIKETCFKALSMMTQILHYFHQISYQLKIAKLT